MSKNIINLIKIENVRGYVDENHKIIRYASKQIRRKNK